MLAPKAAFRLADAIPSACAAPDGYRLLLQTSHFTALSAVVVFAAHRLGHLQTVPLQTPSALRVVPARRTTAHDPP